MNPDSDLVSRARAGDRRAQSELAERFHERVHRYVLTMVGDPASAQDLTQDVFRRAIERLDELRADDSFRSWLFAIAVNLCRTYLRRSWNEPRSEAPQQLDASPDPARSTVLSSIVRRESAEALAVAIDRLPVLLREAFVLHYVENLPYEEMAQITGARVNALQVRSHRARARLRRQLGAIVDTTWLSG